MADHRRTVVVAGRYPRSGGARPVRHEGCAGPAAAAEGRKHDVGLPGHDHGPQGCPPYPHRHGRERGGAALGAAGAPTAERRAERRATQERQARMGQIRRQGDHGRGEAGHGAGRGGRRRRRRQPRRGHERARQKPSRPQPRWQAGASRQKPKGYHCSARSAERFRSRYRTRRRSMFVPLSRRRHRPRQRQATAQRIAGASRGRALLEKDAGDAGRLGRRERRRQTHHLGGIPQRDRGADGARRHVGAQGGGGQMENPDRCSYALGVRRRLRLPRLRERQVHGTSPLRRGRPLQLA